MIKESESLPETQTWSISEYLEKIMAQLDEDCADAFVKTSQFSILQNNAPYENSGLSIVDNTIVLDKSIPALHKVNIVLTSENMVISVSSSFTAIICGFERLVLASGVKKISIELTEDDISNEYIQDFKITDLVKSSSGYCPIDEFSYKLVKNSQGDNLDRSTGENYVKIDYDQQRVYVDKAVAISKSFTLLLVATTLGGIYGGFY
jgi:hypothetical protein